jgi:glucokinase
MKDVLVGLDIGGTKTAVCVGTSPVTILARHEFPTGDPGHTLAEAAEAVGRMLAGLGGSGTAIGIACGGPLDAAGGTIICPPNLPAWRGVPVRDIMSRRLGMPARLENDADAGALAEHRYGAGRGLRDFIFVTFGTGLGAGLILGGSLYRGGGGLAGEIGHVRLADDGPLAYGKAGSAEGLASGAGLALAARSAVMRGMAAGSLLASLPPERITAKAVAEAASAGDPCAAQLLLACGRNLGRALAVLVDVLNPERIAVGGLAVHLGETVLAPARAGMAAEALPATAQRCEVVAAQLGERIGDAQSLTLAQMAMEER